jgi:hypothetical protein
MAIMAICGVAANRKLLAALSQPASGNEIYFNGRILCGIERKLNGMQPAIFNGEININEANESRGGSAYHRGVTA